LQRMVGHWKPIVQQHRHGRPASLRAGDPNGGKS
jgi:hypothetical protein